MIIRGALYWVIWIHVILFADHALAENFPSVQNRPYGPINSAVFQEKLFVSPRHLKNEYCAPLGSIVQTYRWNQAELVWILHVKNQIMDYAGFYLHHLPPMAKLQDDTFLHFKLRPADAADQISIVLIEGGKNGGARRTKVLSTYQNSAKTGKWRSYNIPLNEFLPFVTPAFTKTDEFNWNNIQQIRIMRDGPALTHKKISFRDFRLRSTALPLL